MHKNTEIVLTSFLTSGFVHQRNCILNINGGLPSTTEETKFAYENDPEIKEFVDASLIGIKEILAMKF